MYAGNATVFNTIMRWPLLAIPAAVVVVAKTVPVEAPKAPPPPPPAVVAPAPVPAPKVVPVETLCPPAAQLTKKELAKLTPRQRGELKVKGCIKG